LFERMPLDNPLFLGKAKTTQVSMDLVKQWLPVILWSSFIFLMSTGTFSAKNTFSTVRMVLGFLCPHLTSHQVITAHATIRKAAHVSEYFVLGILLFRAFRVSSAGVWKWQWALLAVAAVVVWALGDEFHQSFVPTRTASIGDVGIDTAGGILAQVTSALWHRYVGRRGHCPVS
jgi:VanZ family protein